MQNTRLNNIVETVVNQVGGWFRNPWRRLSLLIISFLFGIFLGSAIPTTAGQAAVWDIVIAAILVSATELISRMAYGGNQGRLGIASTVRQTLLIESINALKIGLIYSMFIEAFKIGS